MRLLIATSTSLHFVAPIRLGAEIARRTNQVPTVLTVIGDQADQPQADAILATARDLLQAHVPEVQTRVRLGHPAEEIIRELEEGSYDLVIVGEKERHDLLTRFFLGSTAQRVVEYAPCPVIIAKGRVGPLRHILLCDSGAESSSLLSHTAWLATLMDGDLKITVLHVMSQMSAGPGVIGEQLRASAEDLIRKGTPEGELLAQDVQALEQLSVYARAKVRHGLVVEEILDEAQSGDYDLLVIGAHRGTGWQRILLDDLARKIIEKVDRPVLVVK